MKTASLKGQRSVFEGCLMVAAASFDKHTLTDVSGHTGNIANKLDLTYGNKFQMKLKHALPSHP